jgi:hypothetical protein
VIFLSVKKKEIKKKGKKTGKNFSGEKKRLS